uniref:Uncharacterized protein n=1 Tax=Anopheles christyi TaxID=43041 RepID=A0A182K5L6_9DIPT
MKKIFLKMHLDGKLNKQIGITQPPDQIFHQKNDGVQSKDLKQRKTAMVASNNGKVAEPSSSSSSP